MNVMKPYYKNNKYDEGTLVGMNKIKDILRNEDSGWLSWIYELLNEFLGMIIISSIICVIKLLIYICEIKKKRKYKEC